MPTKAPLKILRVNSSLSQRQCVVRARFLDTYLQFHVPSCTRTFATTPDRQTGLPTQPGAQSTGEGTKDSYFRPGLRAKFPLKNSNPQNTYQVNEDPEVLNAVYRKILGERGDELLSEEVKWLAVTHKSFDQGRSGYNDRLAYLGKRIVDLQASLALLNRTDGTFVDPPDEFEREPFRHPGSDLLPRLTEESKAQIVALNRIANLAHSFDLLSVVRWKPRMAADLGWSGVDRVLAQALYAIVGAVALQNGGEVAVRIVREQIISRLGVRV